MNRLLTIAIAQLRQDDPYANRRAAWFARSALEDVIVELLHAKQVDAGPLASGRTKLTCLESLYREEDPDIVARAQYAWSRLSEACHQHAYELAPTYVELAHLVRLVMGLCGAVPNKD
ncbi:hypothetical protein GCM10009785_30410 [Brooklawnia cerclae]|uniref:Uncharacterized protein n=1 Tax=Brooklawnia cerclae TaxID=349934 RepID=A0ABX0SE51_9ACTN|nr:hypothetical protein [Brooklawnia cerclae]NIH56668.1 hypothetical protein [Brooklawnia cerclae]